MDNLRSGVAVAVCERHPSQRRVTTVTRSMGQCNVKTKRRQLAALAGLCAALMLSGCGDMSRFHTAAPTATPATKPVRATPAASPAAEREHERILASYGGA